MRILYIAKHDQYQSTDDEGAITHALTQLGHNVQRVREFKAHKAYKMSGDLLLVHKCDQFDLLKTLGESMPVVFWYFDLVDWPDETLVSRNESRIGWMNQITPICNLGFCTDGDWVAKNKSGKLHWLPQGADERIVGIGRKFTSSVPPILFTGTGSSGGLGRNNFIEMMQINYRNMFNHVERGVYREHLKDYIASSKMVVAPDSPVTDRYWSNRIYNALGFGAFMFHSYAEQLTKHYTDNKEVVYYDGYEDLFKKITYYWDKPVLRVNISQAGLERTIKQHLYRHRCEELLKMVKDKLGVS